MKLYTGTISRLPNLRNKYDKLNTAEMPREERGGGERKSNVERKFLGVKLWSKIYIQIHFRLHKENWEQYVDQEKRQAEKKRRPRLHSSFTHADLFTNQTVKV